MNMARYTQNGILLVALNIFCHWAAAITSAQQETYPSEVTGTTNELRQPTAPPPSETQAPHSEPPPLDNDGCHLRYNETTQQEEKHCHDEPGTTTSQAKSVESATQTQTVEFVGGLNDRIAQQRSGFRSSRSRIASAKSALGGAASADSDIASSGRFSPFVVADGSRTDKRATLSARGYEQDAQTLVLGFDYRIDADLVAGATLNYMSSDTDIDGNAGGAETDNLVLGLHGSKYWGDTYLDALVTYGQIDIDTERVLNATQFNGSTDGSFHSAEIALGQMMRHKQWSITPTVRLLHVRGEIDAYTEKSNTATTSRYASQQFDSFSARASVQADYVFLMNWGVLIPSLYLAYNHEHLGADNITVVNSGTTVQQAGEDPAKNFKVVRLNLAAQFKRGLSGFLSYERLANHELLDRDSVALGFRYEL